MALALLVVCLSSLIAPQPFANQPPPAGEVVGRVIDESSRAPIADVTVTLSPATFPAAVATAPHRSVTDDKGAFTFQRVLPGRYRLQTQKTGFAALAGPGDERTIEVEAGRAVTKLELALRPGATIAGRVLDASGGPAFGIFVSALRRAREPDGRLVATTARMTETNDRGEFQLANLPGGEYVVVAVPVPVPNAAPAPGATIMAPTYFPGTADSASAQAIELAPPKAVTGVEFAMVSRAAHQVSGVVVDQAGAPVPRAIVMLRIDPRAGGAPTPATGATDEAGAFRIGGLVPGTYQITIGGFSRRRVVGGVQTIGAGAGTSSAPSVMPADIIIGDADIKGLTIVVSATR
jgi:hypothetical protein